MLRRLLCLILLWLIACQSAHAATFTPPFVFAPNTVIISSQMNTTLTNIQTSLNNINDSQIIAGAAINPSKFDATKAYPLLLQAAATDSFATGNTGDTIARWKVTTDGKVYWGPGSSTAVDVLLKRSSSAVLAIRNGADNADGSLTAAAATLTGLLTATAGTGTTNIMVGNTGDTVGRWNVTSDGKEQYGPGGATAVDVTLKRDSANTLRIRNGTDAADGNLILNNLTLNGALAAALPIGSGGTGATSLAGNGAVIMNSGGTAQTVVAPGANNNVLTSNGTSWTSAAAGGSVSSSAYQIYTNTSSGVANLAAATQVPENLPAGTKIFGGYGSNASWRAIPSGAGTLTGDYVHYGNLTISGAQTWNRVRLFINGTLTISAAITVGTELSGGAGDPVVSTSGIGQSGSGLGGGEGSTALATSQAQGGGGGGHGGIGGIGGAGAAADYGGRGGLAYSNEHFLAGSGGGGGASSGTAGGAGGGGAYVEATGNIDVNANITAAGAQGVDTSTATAGAGGGGSGGGIAMVTNGTWTLEAGKTISVVGGRGGNATGGTAASGGGGGAGGIVWVRSTGTATNSGTITITGGAAGSGSGSQAAAAGATGISDVTGSAAYPGRTAP